MKQKTQSRPTTFNVGDRVLDLSDIEGVVIDSPYAPELIRVSFDGAGGNWRDLDPSKLRHAETQSEVTVNESKHTLGPWVKGSQDLAAKRINILNGWGENMIVAQTWIGDNYDAATANAHLIAAAPDMLEALTTIVDNASKANVPGEYYLNQIALDLAKNAIAKACHA